MYSIFAYREGEDMRDNNLDGARTSICLDGDVTPLYKPKAVNLKASNASLQTRKKNPSYPKP